jgi:hypothetical protein
MVENYLVPFCKKPPTWQLPSDTNGKPVQASILWFEQISIISYFTLEIYHEKTEKKRNISKND